MMIWDKHPITIWLSQFCFFGGLATESNLILIYSYYFVCVCAFAGPGEENRMRVWTFGRSTGADWRRLGHWTFWIDRARWKIIWSWFDRWQRSGALLVARHRRIPEIGHWFARQCEVHLRGHGREWQRRIGWIIVRPKRHLPGWCWLCLHLG